jgi:hypothetical protein
MVNWTGRVARRLFTQRADGSTEEKYYCNGESGKKEHLAPPSVVRGVTVRRIAPKAR